MAPQKRQPGFRCMLTGWPRPLNGKSCNNAGGPVAEAISRCNQELVAFQAAEQAFVRAQNLSLFNFL